MKYKCKFCGREIDVAKYLSQTEYTCGLCSAHCMKNCELASKTTTSWHREPCVSCEKNPYRIKHAWNGKEWERND